MGVGCSAVTASRGAVSGSTKMRVSGARLVSIAVAPARSTVVMGDKLPMTATGLYSDGSTVDLTTQAVWTTASSAVVTVSNASGSQGLLTAVAMGMTTVSATVGSVAGTTSVTVSTPTLSQIVVSPIAPSLPAGQGQQLTATAIFTNGTS